MDKDKPRIENPEEAAEAHKLLKREHGVPRGRESLEELPKVTGENVSPSPKFLDKDRLWFFPALAYCMMGMDRSLFELYAWAINKDVSTTMHQAEAPVVEFEGLDITDNHWFYLLQGIDRAAAADFCEYIKTYKFNDGVKQLEWCLTPVLTRIADPFNKGEQREGVDIVMLLPECLTSKRQVYMSREPGLALNTPRLNIRMVGNNAG